MVVVFLMLTSEIAKRGIKKSTIAEKLGISPRTLYSKMSGETSFTWEEVCSITNYFFPDMTPNDLFTKSTNTEESA